MSAGLRWASLFGLIAAAALFAATPASAQAVTLDLGADDGLFSERLVQLILMITVMSLAPSILVMATSFVRIVVVLSLLRTALGLQQSPPNSVIVSLALFLTAFVMAPVFQDTYDRAIQPLMSQEMETGEALEVGAAPFKTFMLSQAREADLVLFLDLAEMEAPEDPEALPFRIVAPAFMISELRRAFEIGFLLFIPFLVIDLVVASILMAMGMMMLPPVIISLPFKLVFFVLVDGWRLVAGSLVESFTAGPPAG